MSFDFSDNGYVYRNGEQSSLHSEHAIHSSVKRGHIPEPKTTPQRMEAKLFLTVLSLVGYSSVIAGIWLNIGTWKADILFLSACAFMLLKFIRLTIKTWQSYKRDEIELKILKKKSEE